ncbi:MAG: hypothetical protein ACK55I_35490, partial [bacterium]
MAPRRGVPRCRATSPPRRAPPACSLARVARARSLADCELDRVGEARRVLVLRIAAPPLRAHRLADGLQQRVGAAGDVGVEVERVRACAARARGRATGALRGRAADRGRDAQRAAEER